MKLRKRNIVVLLVPAVILCLLWIAPTATADSASTSTLNDGGVLRLKLGTTDEWRFQPTAGSTASNQTQSVAPGSGCGLNAASLTGALAKLTADNGSVGFVSDSLGVRGAGEGTGTPCGRIDGSQKLNVELGTAFTSPSSGSKRVADFAELDIEGKFNAVFTITGSFGSSTRTEVYDTTSGGSDSGPDSGDGDNFRIRFPHTGKFLFTKLTIAVTSGGASLEGGSDGTMPGTYGSTILDGPGVPPTATTDSLFHLIKYDTALACGSTETQTGSGVPTNSLQRVENEGSANCTGSSPVLIDLEAFPSGPDCSTDQCVSLRKDLMGQTAQFFWTVTWTPEETSLPVNVTQFDFGDGSGFRDIQWCLADDGDTDSYPELPPTASQDDPPGAVDPWCLTSQHSDLGAGTGQLTVRETYFGLGDPGARR